VTRPLYILAIIIVLASLCPAAAKAQTGQGSKATVESQASRPGKKSGSFINDGIYNQLPPEDQERLIEEATYVYDYCMKSGSFSYLHDCGCIAAKSMEVRLNDPESSKTIIAIGDSVAKDCPNGPGAAGWAYEQCHDTYVNVMEYGVKEFCTCYANTFGTLYIENPGSYMTHIKDIGVAATMECSKGDIPNPFDNRK